MRVAVVSRVCDGAQSDTTPETFFAIEDAVRGPWPCDGQRVESRSKRFERWTGRIPQLTRLGNPGHVSVAAGVGEAQGKVGQTAIRGASARNSGCHKSRDDCAGD